MLSPKTKPVLVEFTTNPITLFVALVDKPFAEFKVMPEPAKVIAPVLPCIN